ncbi:MAG: DNA polymerase IV [Anaerolineae bacterium]
MSTPPQRTILHLDLDAFFCAVEVRRNPTLRGKAFAVGGRPDQRGVVASCSYEARLFGVRSAMPMSQAVNRCPELIIVSSNFGAYGTASREVMKHLHNLTPLVEQISIDEAFLDVTGLPNSGEVIARRLQAVINEELDLPCSFGVASNKLIAKIANNIGKAKARGGTSPNAITVVLPGEEAAFLAPLPVEELWGVGPKTAESLHQLGLRTIGEVAAYPVEALARRFGKHGADLAKRARGVDDRPVETEHERKSISKETTFTRDVAEIETLHRTLRHLADGVGLRLRQMALQGTTIKLKLRWADFTTLTRQMTFPHAVDQDDEIYEAALQLFHEAWLRGRPVRLIGVGISGLEDTARQLSLFETDDDKRGRRLQATLDELRDRFGEKSIKRGTDLDDKHRR